MAKAVRISLALLLGLGLFTGIAAAAVTAPTVTIALNPSVPSPSLLGTSITWTATVQGGVQGHTYDFQFSTSSQSQRQIVRDFNLPNTFVWVPWQVEGTYVITVVARDITAQPFVVFAPVSAQYVIRPIVTAPGASAVNPTGHPLVALFSAGSCQSGRSIRVRFQQVGSQQSSTTNTVPCSSTSANFLVAGMLPNTQYQMHWELIGPNVQNNGPNLDFTTGHLPNDFPVSEHMTVNIPATQHDQLWPVVLWQLNPVLGNSFSYWPAATDLSGNIIWYYPNQALMTRMQPGGFFFLCSYTTLAEYDLAGNENLETNVGIINEQLAAKGYPTLTGFNNHETRRLANGNILMLGSRDESSTQYQGGTQQNPVDILGDMVLILDHNLQVEWAWDSFAHLDLSRAATLGDICLHLAQGCPPFNPAFPQANDWLHTNAAQYTPDGNILLSLRAQDWVIKINYGNGTGDGHLMWRMGPFGDFTITNPPQQTCGDPAVFPWFTHQHDAAFQVQSSATTEVMTVFDDGNLRHRQCGGGNSRGMVLNVSEPSRTVTIVTAADLGQYSLALGSAQLLVAPPNPTYASFNNGLLMLPDNVSQATEVDLNGNIVYQLQAVDWSYRTYRARDLYTPTLP